MRDLCRASLGTTAPSLSRSEGEGWGGGSFTASVLSQASRFAPLPQRADASRGKPLPSMARHYIDALCRAWLGATLTPFAERGSALHEALCRASLGTTAPSLSRSEGEGWGGVSCTASVMSLASMFTPLPQRADASPGKPLPSMARHYMELAGSQRLSRSSQQARPWALSSMSIASTRNTSDASSGLPCNLKRATYSAPKASTSRR